LIILLQHTRSTPHTSSKSHNHKTLASVTRHVSSKTFFPSFLSCLINTTTTTTTT
jgi:hypothetical protein